MDKALRNSLRNVVTQCRRLLEKAVAEVLEGQFGIHATGTVEDASKMGHLSADDLTYREQILAHLQHIQASGLKPRDALAQLVREVSFTHLNRLCAYKMMEKRGLIRETVTRGAKSQGFIFYLAEHPEDEKLWSGGQPEIAYRHFLEWLGGTLSEEIGVLFSPHDPANRLFPPHLVLEQALDLINSAELQDIWIEDETIGWVYQYFTPKELRDQARKESQAPRNSYELAFRNQFYTPRYVVEFLTDNTLGRLWYEMRMGETTLKQKCRYLVYRANEVFLSPKEKAPDSDEADHEFPQEELSMRPVYITHRPKQDPREIKILDPACGSGHFLLYCFVLLETIYEEAYEDRDLGAALQKDYPSLAELKKAVPGLILSYNLHGIDIDLRATQIAALALWLRAQRAYQDMGLKGPARPAITKSNIVCAEPMPGEREMLLEYLKRIDTRLHPLVFTIWEKMRLAGEVGSLLKIEQEIADAIAKGREEAMVDLPPVQITMFQSGLPPRQLVMAMASEEERAFWEKAEKRLIKALDDYARETKNGMMVQRQLFADDAAHGFGLVDTCLKQFDVVLMNPPFGETSRASKAYIEEYYPLTKHDVYAAFVERGLEWLRPGGLLGAITSRTGFFLSSFRKWREEILLQKAQPTVFADLGFGVLDTAMVETAAYVLEGR